MKLMLIMLSEIALLTLALAESNVLVGADDHQQVLGKENFDSGIELKPKLEELQQKEVMKETLHQHAEMVKHLEQLQLEQLRIEQEKRQQEERQKEEWQEEQRHLRDHLGQQQRRKVWQEKWQQYRSEHQQQDSMQHWEYRLQDRQEQQQDFKDGFCGTKHFGR